jgi:plasmid stabilization system protein ParE
MSKYILTPEADQDLDDIWEYIVLDDIEAADRWDAKLREACDFLSHNPRAGHPRKDLTNEIVLFWPVAKYLIIYRIQEDGVLIMAVTQGSRDIPSYLRKRS